MKNGAHWKIHIFGFLILSQQPPRAVISSKYKAALPGICEDLFERLLVDWNKVKPLFFAILGGLK